MNIDFDVLIDHDRYYVVKEWKKEKYNNIEHIVPVIEKELTRKEYEKFIIIRHREEKLKKILQIKR